MTNQVVWTRISVLVVILSLALAGCRTYQRVAYAKDWSWTPEAAYAKYFANRQPDTYEGIWPWPDFRVALVKSGSGPAVKYHGYVVQSDISSWFAGDVRFVVSPTLQPGVFEGTEYLSSDGSKSRPLRVRITPSGNFIELVDKTSFALGRKLYPAISKSYREAFIAEYLAGRSLEMIEGAWLIADNNFEVGIIRNPFEAYSNHAFLAVVLDSRISPKDVGQVKILLKQTAAPRIFPAEYKYSGAGSYQGTNLLVENANYFKFAVREGRGYYASSREYAGIRTYPLTPVIGESVVQSDSIVATGTGFLIAADLAVTNYHVVQDSRAVSVVANGERIKAFIAAKDTSNDLVVLKLAKPLASAGLVLGDFSSVRIGERVYTIGFPLSQDLGAKHRLSEGIVSSSVGMQDDPRMFQVSVPIQPGNSGGPLLNRYGEVIGIITSTTNPFFFAKHRGTIPQNIGFAFKVSYLDVLLKEVDHVRPAPVGTRAEASAADLMERSSGSVVLIEARN